MPPHWGDMFCRRIESSFGKGAPNRLHDRFRYTRNPVQDLADRAALTLSCFHFIVPQRNAPDRCPGVGQNAR